MRRYPQFRSTPSQVAALPSVGTAPTGSPTVARRRNPQFGRSLGLVATLPSLGVAAGGGAAFKAAWARNANVMIRTIT